MPSCLPTAPQAKWSHFRFSVAEAAAVLYELILVSISKQDQERAEGGSQSSSAEFDYNLLLI
jgi:hypothetical protein